MPVNPDLLPSRVEVVARWFDLPDELVGKVRPEPMPIELPEAGNIVLVTGASGAGKSSLLRATIDVARAASDVRAVELGRVDLAERAVIDVVADALVGPWDAGTAGTIAAIGLLGQVGLAEARVCVARPSELSDGQRWRLRLAAGLAEAGWRTRRAKPGGGVRSVLFADEFAAVLDRVTAAAVARSLRRAVDHSDTPLAAVVATSHDDLVDALMPDAVVRCDFG